MNITLYIDDSTKANQIATEAYKIADSLNLIYSDYLENSELNKLSSKAGTATFTSVSPALWDIIKQSVEASQKCNGTFDISVGSIVKLWRKARKEKAFPNKNILQKSLR